MQIEFVNHASVLISDKDTAVLMDPWYSGPAFHKGWTLLHETPDTEVSDLLKRTTHLWLSHEHPDHFSVPFFKRHGAQIRAQGIEMYFQKIEDQRVADFIRAEGITLHEMTFGQSYTLGDLELTCLKDDFYDSLVSIKSEDQHILNLNDCHVNTPARAKLILDQAGPCDVLLTQFSYAAWKGGPENRAWRETAAREKLDNIALQAELLKPRTVIPFASYVAFSNERNAYLNDAANRPQDVIDRFKDADFDLQIMAPGDVFTGTVDPEMTARAISFWDAAYSRAETAPLQRFETKSYEEIAETFQTYTARVFANNSRWMMRAAQVASPVRVFQPVVVELDDLGINVKIDVPRAQLTQTTEAPHLKMHSESLWFLFSNSFGFDTLGVNGCFEEMQEGGFSRAAKSIAIENLNNLGIRFGPGLVFEGKVIAVFFERLIAASRKLRGQS
ncbi:MBL fold metallo-hydrolase [Alphaproteobacteria bacterium KMM 3653]|uniref:MBL fold metallo-hydrolase n=1 Tax=Harenicola maris TaxID=2841044 RepID=A0AAP2CMR5_9RHOB|nr:MBL fold metallo-hydrolase [Harenicola maris]